LSTYTFSIKAYRKSIVILKVIIVHGWLLSVEAVVQGEGILLVEEKVYTFGKGDLSSGVHGVLILGVQNQG